MKNILFTSVPYTETKEPVMAPAVLKGALANIECNVTAIDLNIEVIRLVEKSSCPSEVTRFFTEEYVTEETLPIIGSLISHCVKRIKEFNPDVIGLSLLSYTCHMFTKWLLVQLRTEFPHAKLLIGGSGIKHYIVGSPSGFCTDMQEQGLIDDYITGDSEVSIIEYVSGNLSYPGINSDQWKTLNSLDDLPFADYSDYDFSLYDEPVIPIVDSRGCIRKCEFCNIIEFWKKYQYRSADTTFAEMLYQMKKHGINRFSFRNALTNGNMKEFTHLVEMMKNYNLNNADDQLSWYGYFIVRNKSHHSEELWNNISISNGSLMLGIESVIERVRYQIGKKFTDEDIEVHFEMAAKFNVPLRILLIVGYPTETLDDYEKTKQWFRDHAKYAGSIIESVALNHAAILPGTTLATRQTEYKLESSKNPSIWINQNLNISPRQREQYYTELNDLITSLGFTNDATPMPLSE